MSNKIGNPFIINGKYVSSEYFCDREVETAEMVSNIVNWRNTVLVSSRRMGKSGLIEHVFAQPSVSGRFVTMYVDVFETSNLSEFVFLLGKEIMNRLQSRSDKLRDKFLSIVSSIKAGIEIDSVSGLPSVQFSLGSINAPQKSLEQIFEFLEASEIPCVVAIDEFQQLAEYKEGGRLIALLRSLVQSCRQTRFIFAGSNRRMMGKLFNSPSEPFFMSCTPLYVEAIDRSEYKKFADRHFQNAGKRVDDECFDYVYDIFEGHTWYVQYVLNRLFEETDSGGCSAMADAVRAINYILDIYHRTFQEMMLHFSDKQKALLIAIAKEGKVSGLLGMKFISEHGLGSASSVQGAARPLLADETIVREDGQYRISNRFFSMWLDRRY